MISVEKPGSPSEILEHAGVKGMKWGVRKAVDTAGGISGGVKDTYKRYQAQTFLGKRKAAIAKMPPAARVARTEHQKKIAKRVAIGVATTSVVAASAFVAYKLRQNQTLKASQIRRADVLESQGDSIMAILGAATSTAEDLR